MPLPRSLKVLAGLRAFGDRKARLAVERRHVDVAPEGRGREADRNLAVQVVTVALEHGVLLDVNFDV